MNEIDVKIHKLGIVTDALSGKEGDGLVVSFGEFKQTALSWKSFKQLIGLRCPKVETRTVGTTIGHGTGSGSSRSDSESVSNGQTTAPNAAPK